MLLVAISNDSVSSEGQDGNPKNTRSFKNWILTVFLVMQNVLYMMIVNMPTEGEMAAARTQMSKPH